MVNAGLVDTYTTFCHFQSAKVIWPENGVDMSSVIDFMNEWMGTKA